MKSEETVPLLIPRKDLGKTEIAHFGRSNRTVDSLSDYPELTKAVREGDVAEISAWCLQLFELNLSARGPLSSGSGPS